MLWFLPNRGGLLPLALALFLLTLSPAPAADDTWTPLFDGETLGAWERVDTGGSGEVEVREGAIRIAQGVMGSGIRYNAPQGEPFPTENYEIEFAAQRTTGTDFFAALTFPVGDSCCTFINGGWGGALVGLSCIDGYDASENNSSSYYGFKNKTWYIFRVRVSKRLIQVWLDDEPIIKSFLDGKEVSIRIEMDRFAPLGFATWVTEGRIKNIFFRRLTEEEIAEIDAEADARTNAPAFLPPDQLPKR